MKKSVDNTEEFRCISLCSGYAGIELGLKRVVPNFRTVVYVEVEAFATANLVAKIEEGRLDATPIWTDIKTFDGRPFYKRVHIITAGYPCQGESCAGKRLGESDPRWLWPHIERIIKAVKPVWFFGENVPGHLTLGFPTVYRSLRLMGYSVEAGLFTAAEVGAPHKRQRLFILAYNNKQGLERQTRGQLQGVRGGFERCSELADTGHNTGCSELRQQQKERTKEFSRSNKLADATAQRIQGTVPERTAQAGRQIDEQGFKWPARPGQPQYEWEEPRVVANSKQKRHRRFPKEINRSDNTNKRNDRNKMGSEVDGCSRLSDSEGQAQSRLGRAIDGTSSRLDKSKGINNEKVLNVQQTDSRKKQMEQEILQQSMLWQIDNAQEPIKNGKSKKGAEGNQTNQVPEMQQENKDAATSRRLQQTAGCSDIVPEMPYKGRNEVRTLGQSENRIDRLRLLGNGVVPPCAEKAFRNLMELYQ